MPLHDELQRLVQSFEADASMLQVDQLAQRLHVLDVLDAHFGGPGFPGSGGMIEAALCHRAKDLADKLEVVNSLLYAEIRADVQRGRGAAALLRWVPSFTATARSRQPIAGFSYDSLDELVRGVLRFEEPRPPQIATRQDMVFYQPTPARHVFRLIELIALSNADVLVDLGSGLGHVTLLVTICTPAHSVGIEIEQGYVACARRCAQDLHLGNVSFVQQDARTADLSRGTVFYLHTPFTGSIMRTVLDRLRGEAETRRIRICTYGPCTAVIAKETWLKALTKTENDQVAVFTSRV